MKFFTATVALLIALIAFTNYARATTGLAGRTLQPTTEEWRSDFLGKFGYNETKEKMDNCEELNENSNVKHLTEYEQGLILPWRGPATKRVVVSKGMSAKVKVLLALSFFAVVTAIVGFAVYAGYISTPNYSMPSFNYSMPSFKHSMPSFNPIPTISQYFNAQTVESAAANTAVANIPVANSGMCYPHEAPVANGIPAANIFGSRPAMSYPHTAPVPNDITANTAVANVPVANPAMSYPHEAPVANDIPAANIFGSRPAMSYPHTAPVPNDITADTAVANIPVANPGMCYPQEAPAANATVLSAADLNTPIEKFDPSMAIKAGNTTGTN